MAEQDPEKSSPWCVTQKEVEDANIIKQYAKQLYEGNQLKEAEEKYIAAMSLNPNDIFIYDQLCQITFALKSYHKALRFAFLTIERDPSGARYWYQYASCWKVLGNDKFAAISFQTARDLGAPAEYTPTMKEQQAYVDGFDAFFLN